jgi:PKD repeat protein
MKITRLLPLAAAFAVAPLSAQLSYPFPQMVPDEFMEPGFHESVNRDTFPAAMRSAITSFSRMINDADANALFEQRTFTGSRVFQGEGSFSTQTLNYEIMYPHPDAVPPPGGFPLVFTTYGRGRLAEAMALDAYREHYPAYVVAFLHGERPGPLHAPPVYLDYAFLFIELFEWLFDEYNIDTDRVYGSGWSRGGSSMTILSHAYAQRPEYDGIPLITAAVPSAGGFQDLLDNAVESIKDVKWFSLQGANDSNSNPRGSLFAFDQLEKAGALDNIFWWVENTGHSPHSLGWNIHEAVEWMFAQTKADLRVRPDAVLDINLTDADVPLTFTANAAASTPNNGGTIAGYTWQLFKSQAAIADYSERPLHGWTLDTGFQGAPVIGTGASVTYTLDEPGTYWLRVIVEDDEGNRRAATQEIHARAVMPVAAFTFSRNHEATGRPIHFDASATTTPEYQATISTYAWSFGDGHTATGETVAHTFATAGTYDVQLTVTSSGGQTHSLTQTVTVTEQFPGYRYFRFVGLTTHQTYRTPETHLFGLRAGSRVFPEEPMTGNNSLGISLNASWNPQDTWRMFDQNPSTRWDGHNYHTPMTWDMDVGENQRFVPTGVNMRMAGGNHRWSDFDLRGSVDGETWDTLWERRRAVDGLMNTAGEEIEFSGVPFVEVTNLGEGPFLHGMVFDIQAHTRDLDNITEVAYFANGEFIGTGSATAPHTLTWEPPLPGDYTLTAEVTHNGGATRVVTHFPVSFYLERTDDLIPLPPYIEQQPASASAFEGGTVVLEAVAQGFPLITGYQWFKDGAMLFDNARITGSQSPILTIEDLRPSDAGAYTLHVTNDEGTTTTIPAMVEVVILPDLALFIDFGTNHTAPVGNWNSLNASASHTNLINFADGTVTPVVIDMITTGGSGIQTSGNNTAWGSRTVAPDWADANALDDRLWVDRNHSATLRFRNLNPNRTYTLEIASGFAGAGTNGNEPGIFRVMGADGIVEGFNAHSGESLGTQVHWTSRSPADGGNAPHAQEGWMIWNEVAPTAEGQIDVLLSTTSDSTARVSLNAARLMETVTSAPAPEITQQPQGLTISAGDSATFTVVASGEAPISYQWQKDGEPIVGADSATFTIPSAGVGDSGAYRVAVTNPNGTTLSAAAQLIVNGIVPTITEWPVASSLVFGQTLAQATLSGGSANVSGTFAFADPGLQPGVGTADQQVIFTPDDLFTYEPVQSTVAVTVEPASGSVTLSGLTVTYNGTPQAPTVTTDPAGLEVQLTFDGESTPPLNAGTYSVVATITDPNASGSTSGTFTIEPAAITVRAQDTGKFEGDPDPALDWMFLAGELFAGDSLSGALERAPGEAIGSYPIQQGTLAASANYILTFMPGTFTIMEASDAPWVLQAEFDDLNPGILRGQGGWSGNNDAAAQVIQDPEDEDNQVFRFAPGNNNSVGKDLTTAIETGEVATLFFRFYVPAGTARINQQIRLPGLTPIRVKWDSDPSDPVLSLFGEDMSGASQQKVEQTILRNTWHDFWMVIDNANGRYQIYLQGGDLGDQTLVTVGDMGTDPLAHPFQTGLIDALVFIGWSNGPMLFDDFYLAHGGENLTNPVALAPPGSGFGAWIDGFGDLPPEERSALANPAGDGLPNLLKYALDLDPALPAHGAERTVVGVLDDAGARVIELRVPEGLSRPDLHYILEISEDLAIWEPLAEAVGHTTFSAASGAPVSTVAREGEVVSVSLEATAPTRAFYRLTVTLLE